MGSNPKELFVSFGGNCFTGRPGAHRPHPCFPGPDEIISLFAVFLPVLAVLLSFFAANFKFAPRMNASGFFQNFINTWQCTVSESVSHGSSSNFCNFCRDVAAARPEHGPFTP